MVIKYNGKVTDKGLHIYNRSAFDQDIKLFHSKEVTIKIERKKKSRSIDQNAFLHGVVIPMAREAFLEVGYRYSIDETKTDLKRMFAVYEKVNEQTGELREYIKATSEMTTTEMMDFIAQVQQWAAEFAGVVIPDPKEQLTFEL